MLICVYGAGSVGCYVGGKLAAAGGDVRLIGRQRLAAQLDGNGVTVTDFHGGNAHVAAPRYETSPASLAEADLVLVTMKSAATREAAETLARLHRPGAVVISLQNGLRNAGILAEHLPQATVLAGIVGFNVVNRGEGVFHRATAGDLEVEQSPALKRFTGTFQRAGVELLPRNDIKAVQAAKLLLNLNNALNALCGLPLREQLSQRAFRRCLALAQREALGVLAAAGTRPARLTPLPPTWIPALLNTPDAVFTRLAKRMLAIDPLARSSMWEDLETGRTTEVDHLNGEVTALAAADRRTAPVNERLVALIRDAEQGGRRDWTGPELLTELSKTATRLRRRRTGVRTTQPIRPNSKPPPRRAENPTLHRRHSMAVLQAPLYVAAVILLVLGALPLRRTRGISLPLLGAACALLAYALPTFSDLD